MKYPTVKAASIAFDDANGYERAIPDGRVIIYGSHTDGAGRNAFFWVCRQSVIPGRGATVAGQRYLDRDGQWREPHGLKYVRRFSTPAAAIKFADSIAE
jgi:hypothetical protein